MIESVEINKAKIETLDAAITELENIKAGQWEEDSSSICLAIETLERQRGKLADGAFELIMLDAWQVTEEQSRKAIGLLSKRVRVISDSMASLAYISVNLPYESVEDVKDKFEELCVWLDKKRSGLNDLIANHKKHLEDLSRIPSQIAELEASIAGHKERLAGINQLIDISLAGQNNLCDYDTIRINNELTVTHIGHKRRIENDLAHDLAKLNALKQEVNRE